MGSWHLQVAEVHSYVGIVVMSVATMQVLAGLLRPDPSSSLRPLFNWGHWFLGNSAHVLAGRFSSFHLLLTTRIFGYTEWTLIWSGHTDEVYSFLT